VAVPVSRGSLVAVEEAAIRSDDLVAYVCVRGEDVVCHHRCFPAETVQEGDGAGL
jgi:hypothetical protein